MKELQQGGRRNIFQMLPYPAGIAMEISTAGLRGLYVHPVYQAAP